MSQKQELTQSRLSSEPKTGNGNASDQTKKHLSALKIQNGEHFLDFYEKSKIYETMQKLFQNRNWDENLIPQILKICAERILNTKPLKQPIYFYFETVVANYLNDNKELLKRQTELNQKPKILDERRSA